jgi:hypothetical protein
MSVDYYIRLEQGRGPNPSRQVLTALARALRLDGSQRDHLFHLAGQAPPQPGASGDRLRPAVLRILDSLRDAAAFIVNDRLDVLAWNPLAAALLCDYAALPPERRNLLWMAFCEPGTWDRFAPEEHERLRSAHVAALRAVCARRPDDVGLRELVARLRTASPEFGRLWAGHEVHMHDRQDRKALRHPAVGPIELDCEVLHISEHDQRLVVLSAPIGTSAHGALRLLATVGLPFTRWVAAPAHPGDKAKLAAAQAPGLLGFNPPCSAHRDSAGVSGWVRRVRRRWFAVRSPARSAGDSGP